MHSKHHKMIDFTLLWEWQNSLFNSEVSIAISIILTFYFFILENIYTEIYENIFTCFLYN